MQVDIVTYQRLAKSIGALLTLMGLSLAAVFAAFVLTGTSPLADSPVHLDGPGLLVLASIGAFTLPLGLSLFSEDDATSARLRIAGYALGLMALLRLVAFSSAEIRATVGLTPLIEFFVLGGVGAAAWWVRPNTEPSIELALDLELAAPAAHVWTVLGEEFGEVDTFASGVVSSSMEGPVGVGAVRACQTPAFGPFPSLELTETLTEFNRETMTYAYVAGGELPRLISSSNNRWSVEAVGNDRCRVRSRASIELRWWALPLAPLLRRSIRSQVVRFGDDLRNRVEQDTVSR